MAQKVLFTASTYSHLKSFHLPYLRWFHAQGWEVHVACAGVPAAPPDFISRAVELPFCKRLSAPENFRAAALLRRCVQEEGYALITTHTTLAAFFTRLALKGLRRRPKLVDMVHGYLFDDRTAPARRALLLGAERLTARETDLLLTMNAWDARVAARYRLGRRLGRVPGVGVDFRRLDAASAEDGAALRREYALAPDAFLVVYAAEFSPRKSQRVLLEALARLPERVVLALPGTGALQEACALLAERLEVRHRVIFPGQAEDMPRWYRAADAAATASRSEGLPFNVMEAMYCGLPVVASAVKGHTDLIDDGVSGLLYPYGDAAACAEALLRLLSDAPLRDALRETGRRRVQPFGREAVFPVVTDLYLSVLDRRPSAAQQTAGALAGV